MCSLVVRTPQLSIAVRFGKSEDNACQPDAFWVYFVICVLLLSEIGLNLLLEDMFKKPQQSPVAYALRVCVNGISHWKVINYSTVHHSRN